MRAWTDVRKVIEKIKATITPSEDIKDDPEVVDVTDAGQALTRSPARARYRLQNVGPDSAKVRENDDAGTGDDQYDYIIEPGDIATEDETGISKIGFICETGETAKIVVTTWKLAP